MAKSQPREYRIVLHRHGPLPAIFEATRFSILIQATDPEGAIRQAEQFAAVLNDHFHIVDVYPADSRPDATVL